MAAPIDLTEKLSKADRKARKKQFRSQRNLFQHDGICTTNDITEHLVVANGGLDNNVQHEELWTVFSPHGTVIDVTMQPQKSYSFVSFSSKQEAAAAMKHVHAQKIVLSEALSARGIVFYLSYVQNVPGCEVPKTDLPPGLVLLKDYISEDEEQMLLSCVAMESESSANNDVKQSSLKHRQVKHFGYEFVYGINNIDPSKPLVQAIPEECNPVLERLLKDGHVTVKPDQLTVNQYTPGQGIPPHTDTHSACEDGIISVSLGSQVVMDFRHPDGRHIPVLLPQRSALMMTGESRYVWTHGITPRKSDIVPVTTSVEDTDSAESPVCDGNAESSTGGLTLVKRGVRTSLTFRKTMQGPCQCKYAAHCDSQKSKPPPPPPPVADTNLSIPHTDTEAARLERLHVHSVYDDIADHFSDTRHRAWPRVADFLGEQRPGAVVADIGCGNGKYLGVNKDTFSLGCDRSANLCEICASRDFPVFVCDVLSVPLRDAACDVAISIAVIHHLATKERRRHAVEEMVRVLRSGGQALISVWALEQELDNKPSNYLQKSRNAAKSTDDGAKTTDKLTVHVNRTQFDSQDLLVPWHKKNKNNRPKNKSSVDCDNTKVDSESSDGPEPVYHRFYHVFQKGELEELVLSVSSTRIVESYYDKGNWCVIFEKIL